RRCDFDAVTSDQIDERQQAHDERAAGHQQQLEGPFVDDAAECIHVHPSRVDARSIRPDSGKIVATAGSMTPPCGYPGSGKRSWPTNRLAPSDDIRKTPATVP